MRKKQLNIIIRQNSRHLQSTYCFIRPKNQELKNQSYDFSNSLIASSIQRCRFSSQSYEKESDKKVSVKRKRRRASVKRSKFSDNSDSDSDPRDLSSAGLINLLRNNEKLLKQKQLEMENIKDKALRIVAENDHVIQRTKQQTENCKKIAIQSFAKSLLDVADNLGRASSVVKDRFIEIEATEDFSGALSLLKTFLEGVEMTEKQLAEVFKKFGLERYDPLNEQFDPNRHNAVFQVPDQSKPPNTVAVVMKPGYALHERIIRPAEVGVVIGVAADNKETN